MKNSRPSCSHAIFSICSLATLLFCSSFAHAAKPESAAPEQSKRPNVVLILVDDLAWGDLSAHGNPYVQTKNIDQFAKQSLELARYRTQMGCSPTRAAILTGRHPFCGGVAHVYDHLASLDGDAVTLAEALKDSGYRTALVGKWHLDAGKPSQKAGAQGFDHVLTFPGPALKPGGYSNMVLWRNDKKEEQNGYCMDVFTDEAIAWIQANKNAPFFLYFPANLIHSPLEVPDEFIDHASSLSDPTKKTYGMLRNFDMNFGRLMQALNDNGLEENTLVVFTLDDGHCGSSKPFDRFNKGFHGLKGTVYEGGIRVSCYVRWPAKLKAPAVVEENTSDIDLVPTVLAACGAPDPTGVSFDGKNLLPLLEDPQAPWPERNLFCQGNGSEPIRDRVFAVVSGKWKLAQPCMLPEESYIRKIKAKEMEKVGVKGRANLDGNYAPMCKAQGRPFRSISGEQRYELYDLEADPNESNDLAVTHPEIVTRLREAYDAWFTDVERGWHIANEKEKASEEGRPRSKQQAEQS